MEREVSAGEVRREESRSGRSWEGREEAKVELWGGKLGKCRWSREGKLQEKV